MASSLPCDGREIRGPWCYRVLRKNETPGDLRIVPEKFEKMERAELRISILEAIAHGNNPGRTSPFVHATTSLSKAKVIFTDRGSGGRALYRPMIVRWPMVAVPESLRWDFSLGAARGTMGDEIGDSQEIQDDLVRLRKFVDKAKEIVLLPRPASHVQECWCIYQKKWLPAAEWQAPLSNTCLLSVFLSIHIAVIHASIA